MAEITKNLDDLIIGQKIAGCLIEERIGKGGMATVYRAVRDQDETVVALKILSQHTAETDNGIARFQREARLMQSLEHPHILPVYEYGTLGGMIYLIMKIVEGGSLESLLHRGRLPSDITLRLLKEITSALDYAHDLGVVHRDLKPGNILLDTNGTSYLTDFGIAKWKEESVGLTLTGMVLGTPGYMAPEQWRTDPVDRRTDVYALGIMTFKMLTGRLPFSAETPFSLMYKHLDEPPPLATDFVPDLDPSLDNVIQRALRKEPEFRYASASDFFLSLQEAVAGTLDQRMLSVHNPDEATALMVEGGIVNVSNETVHTHSGYPLAVAVGARALLNRGREALREAGNNQLKYAVAAALVNYVQALSERAKEAPDTTAGPYKALESYDIGDHRLFFGRETAIDGMLARAPFSKFTVLHAESGAGKTSLIRAGLMPRLLAGGFLPLYVPVRVSTPQDALKRLLLPTTHGNQNFSVHALLKTVAEVVGPTREIFIFFDQFETFFTDVFSDEDRLAFTQDLAACIDDPLLQVRVTLAMRTEYFGMVARFQPYIERPFERELLLRRLTRDEAERALLYPAREQAYTYEEGLSERILDDLSDENNAIAPPQLQLVGTALVENTDPNEKFLSIASYEAAGGTEGVLGSYLKRMIDRLPTTQREIGRIIIENLVRDDQTRAVRTADELRAILAARGIETGTFTGVLAVLREGHVLRVLDTERGPAYELVHDYLAQQIQVDPESAALRATQELLDRRQKDYLQVQSLLTSAELNVIRTHRTRLAITPIAQELITLSQRTYNRQRQRMFGLISAAIVGIVGALALGLLFTIRENENQQRQLELAEQAAAERDDKLIEESERLSILVEDYLDVDPMVSLNLALEALLPRDRPYVPAAEFALSVAIQNVNESLYLPATTNTIGALWSPDQSQILWWGREQVYLTDATSGETLAELSTGQAVLSAAFVPTGDGVLLGDQNGRLAFYTLSNGFELVWEQAAAYEFPIRGVHWLVNQSAFLVWSVQTPGFNYGSTAVWGLDGTQIYAIEGTLPQLDPEGEWIATRDENQQIHLLSLINGQTNVITVPESGINVVAWSRNGKRLLTWATNAPITIWDVATLESVTTLRADAPIRIMSVSQSDFVAAIAGDEVLVWDAMTGELVQTLRPNDATITDLVWHPASTQLLAFGEATATTLWDVSNWSQGELPAFAELFDVTDTLQSARWSPSGRFVTITSQNSDPEDTSTIMVWDTTSGSVVAMLRGHTEQIGDLVWDIDESRLLSVGERDNSVRVWRVIEDPDTLQYGEVVRFSSTDGRTLAAVWNPAETLVATGHDSGVVRIWNTATGELEDSLQGHTAPVDVLTWSHDGNLLLTGSDDGLAIIWNVGTSALLQTLYHTYDDQRWKVWWADWAPNDAQVLTTSDDGAVRIWDVATGEERHFFANSFSLADDQDPGIGTTSAFWNADGTKIVASSDDGAVNVWNVETGELERALVTDFLLAFGATWNDDESQILTWGADFFELGLASVYDTQTGNLLFNIEGHEDWLLSAEWSPDETRILTSGRDATIRLWDAQTGEPLYQITSHADSVPQVVWGRDGSRFLSRGLDGTIRVWEASSGVELYRVVLDGTARPTDIHWNNAGNRILAAIAEDNRTGTARIINTQNDLDSLISYAKSLVTRPLTTEQRRVFLGQ